MAHIPRFEDEDKTVLSRWGVNGLKEGHGSLKIVIKEFDEHNQQALLDSWRLTEIVIVISFIIINIIVNNF